MVRTRRDGAADYHDDAHRLALTEEQALADDADMTMRPFVLGALRDTGLGVATKIFLFAFRCTDPPRRLPHRAPLRMNIRAVPIAPLIQPRSLDAMLHGPVFQDREIEGTTVVGHDPRLEPLEIVEKPI